MKFWEVFRVFMRKGDTEKIGERVRRRRPSFRSPKRRIRLPSSMGRRRMVRDRHSSAAMQQRTDNSGSHS